MLAAVPALGVGSWALLALAGLLIGFSKTAVPGVNTISVAIFAALIPARLSTGAVLVLVLVGDLFAIWHYRKHAHWPTLIRLAPAVLVGLAAGAGFLAVSDNATVRHLIGWLLLGLVAVTLWLRMRPAAGPAVGRSATWQRAAYGSLGGFTTMVANAGGPVMSLYFLVSRFPVAQFLGTSAWFFFLVNLAKLPVSVGLGLINASILALAAMLVPAVVAGAVLGRRVIGRVSQRAFEWVVLAFTVVGAIYLLV